MKAFPSYFFVFFLGFAGCAGSNQIKNTPIQQGIEGFILIERGNRMPDPDKPASSPQGFATTVFFYPVTELNQLTPTATTGLFQPFKTKSIDSVSTDATGYFSISLPAGKYSIFVKYKDGLYANWFNEKNQVSPVEVSDHKISTVKFTVSAGATY